MRPPTTMTDQRTEALRIGNQRRLAGCEIRKHLRAGTVSLADALFDDRAQYMTITRLLEAQYGWGPYLVERTLAPLHIWGNVRVGELSERQRLAIVMEAGL